MKQSNGVHQKKKKKRCVSILVVTVLGLDCGGDVATTHLLGHLTQFRRTDGNSRLLTYANAKAKAKANPNANGNDTATPNSDPKAYEEPLGTEVVQHALK